MTVKVSKKSSRKALEKAVLKTKSSQKKVDLSKYFGKVNFGVDGLTYQKKIRNEWA
jgi:hypothetical protein